MSTDQYRAVDFRRLTQEQAAAMHGMDARTLRRWCGVGMPRNADGSYDGPSTIRWRVENSDRYGRVDVYRLNQAIAREQALAR